MAKLSGFSCTSRMTTTMAEAVTTSLLIVVFLLSLSTFSLASFNLSTLAFGDAYSPLFGHHNIHRSSDDKSVGLGLDRSSGSGFISKDMYHHGFFSASIKLPSDYTAGVVVAFYTSNGDVFRHTHDELDWEFLGNIKGEEWRVQTNVYGNGSTGHGREERYLLWFDPTKEFHRYGILWTTKTIIFYVDDVPIREVVRTATMGGDYPSKPMSLYATIWDGSTWATLNGRYKADYKYAPFVAEFSDFILQGCAVDPIQQVPEKCNNEEARFNVEDFAVITQEKRAAMQQFRQTYMAYSHCYDRDRYPNPMPECVRIPEEEERFKSSGHLKIPHWPEAALEASEQDSGDGTRAPDKGVRRSKRHRRFDHSSLFHKTTGEIEVLNNSRASPSQFPSHDDHVKS